MKLSGLFTVIITILFISVCSLNATVRLKDIARIEGVRDNQLVGRGIVIGLDGTGDKTLIAVRMAANMLKHMDISITEKELKIKNVAAVVVTATLPPFARPGDKLEISVSSIGDAKSLAGGTLLMCPLKAGDQSVYAVAQGAILLGNDGVNTDDGFLTSGRIPDGAIVEREVPTSFIKNGEVRLVLKQGDFVTANRTSRAISQKFGEGRAQAIDSRSIIVKVPYSFMEDEVGFIASLQNIEVVPDHKATIVLNSKTKTVIVGEGVKLSSVAMAHGKLNVTVGGVKKNLMDLPANTTLTDLVSALNALNVNSDDMTAIFESLKASGALHADLIVR